MSDHDMITNAIAAYIEELVLHLDALYVAVFNHEAVLPDPDIETKRAAIPGLVADIKAYQALLVRLELAVGTFERPVVARGDRNAHWPSMTNGQRLCTFADGSWVLYEADATDVVFAHPRVLNVAQSIERTEPPSDR